MNIEKDYLDINRCSWNDKVIPHINSSFYDMEAFRAGKNSLKSIEIDLLGNVVGKTILHLQCHFGQDSLSLSRMGARVTGIDFSDEAIAAAILLNDSLGTHAQFACTDVYTVPEVIAGKFDVVFTSYGTIGWLPDLDKWANVISGKLRTGGSFVFAEFHPFLWMYKSDFTGLAYSYFNDKAIVETYTGTYADKSATVPHEEICWNHSLAEVFTALIGAGLEITSFREYDYSPYDCFEGMTETSPGKFKIKNFEYPVPHTYSLVATKK